MHKVIDPDATPRADGRGKLVQELVSPDLAVGGFPVLVLHGLFQSSGSFVTSEDRSLAFWLAKKAGYQVYLGNTRGVFDMGHRNFSRNDPRFWGMSTSDVVITTDHRLDWTIRELAMYDLPTMVEHVCRETGYDKVCHSPAPVQADSSPSDRIHRSLPRQWSGFHRAVARHVPLPRQETLRLHRPRPCSLRRSLDYRIPLHQLEPHRMDDMEEILWGLGLYPVDEMGI